MNARAEYATGDIEGVESEDLRGELRGSHYPEWWGIPPGRPDSEERLEWVKTNVRVHMRAREVRKQLTARVNPMRACIELMRKRYSPADIHPR